MAQNKNLTPEQLAKLLAVASAQTGLEPERLLELLRGGELLKAAAMFGGEGGRMQELFASGKLEELLETPAAQALLAELTK